MKYINLIKLLSVLLCVVMLFAACDSANGTATETPTDTETDTSNATESPTEGATEAPTEKTTEETPTEESTEEPYVEKDPIFENFFNLEYVEDWDLLGEVERIDGEILAHEYGMLVIKNSSVDHKNMVTDTYTVYNIKLGKAVLTYSNTYENGIFAEFDWNDFRVTSKEAQSYKEMYGYDFKYPSNVIDISLDSFGIVLKKATVTPINRKSTEDNDNANIYKINVEYEYYDTCGTKVTTETAPGYYYSYDYGTSDAHGVCFADTLAFFNNDGELVAVIEGENKKILGGFDVKNDKYGYFLEEYQYGAFDARHQYFEVYDLASGECLHRYYLPDEALMNTVCVLKNGNLVIQSMRYADEESNDYDAAIILGNHEIKCLINTVIFDVKTGKTTAVEFDYLLVGIISEEDMYDSIEMEENGVTLVKNAVNVAVVCPIENRTVDIAYLMGGGKLAIFNNNLELAYELENLIPEHYVELMSNDVFGIKVLKNGDLLVSVNSPAQDVYRAIVTADGNVRSYLKSYYDDEYGMLIAEDLVVGDYVINADRTGIYDYDMKLLYEFEENGYTFVTTIGQQIIVEKTEDMWELEKNNDTFIRVSVTKYYALVYNGEGFEAEQVFDGQTVMIDQCTPDYIITISNDGNNKFTAYNADLEHILTTDEEMRIEKFGDNYIIYTMIFDVNTGEYVNVIYTVK